MSRRRAVLLVNNAARRARRGRIEDEVAALLSRHLTVVRRSPRSALETEELAREAAEEGFEIVVVGGGDGTLNAAANGLAGSESSLGVIPLGTANDLARELAIPSSLLRATSRVALGSASSIDVVSVNGRGFCTVAGLGLVARSTRAAARARASWLTRAAADVAGSSIYRLVTSLELLSTDSLLTDVSIEYTEAGTGVRCSTEGQVHALFVTNHRTLGGGLRLPVESSAEDGVFELLLVRKRSRASLLINFARLAAGHPVPDGVIQVIPATAATITTHGDEAFVADGEVLATGRAFEVSIRPRALRVIS
jgi:diacylglycerol kinase (ATP)